MCKWVTKTLWDCGDRQNGLALMMAWRGLGGRNDVKIICKYSIG
jgi:hypothetical protein